MISGIAIGRASRRVRLRWRFAILALVAAILVLAGVLLMASSVLAPGTPPGPPTSGFYGSIAADAKANIQVGGADGGTGRARVSHRFRAGTTAALTSIRFAQRGGPGYSGGDGGTMRISVRSDDRGNPSDTVLATVERAFGNPSGDWSTYHDTTFPERATLRAGELYHITFENTSRAGQDFISINELLVFDETVPRQPLYPDADYAVLYATDETWSVLPHFTAVMDLTYSDGHHDGMGYIESMWQQFGTISGDADQVRQRFTVSGGDRVVTSASVRVRRSSGTSPLTITLETGGGDPIESLEISADDVPIVAGDDPEDGSGTWASVRFTESRLLSNGSTYELRLTTAVGTEYTVVPVREGTDSGSEGGTGNPSGFRSYRFTDGHAEGTHDGGATWTDLYEWSPVDLQFYFE